MRFYLPFFQEKPQVVYNSVGIPPWDAYNDDKSHWQAVMSSHGWQLKEEKNNKIPVVMTRE